jgi:hypothetical protein
MLLVRQVKIIVNAFFGAGDFAEIGVWEAGLPSRRFSPRQAKEFDPAASDSSAAMAEPVGPAALQALRDEFAWTKGNTAQLISLRGRWLSGLIRRDDLGRAGLLDNYR